MRLVLHMQIMLCCSLSITTPVSPLVNEFDIRNVLHEQVSLKALKHIYVFHEAMAVCYCLNIY